MLVPSVRPFFASERPTDAERVEGVCKNKGTCTLAEQGGRTGRSSAVALARYLQGSILIVRRPLNRSQILHWGRPKMDYIPDFMTNVVRGQDHATTPVKGQMYDTVVLFLTQASLEQLHFLPIASPGMFNRGEWGCAVSQRSAVADSVRVPVVNTAPGHNPGAHRLRLRTHRTGKNPFVRGTREWSARTVQAMRVEQECCVQLTAQQNQQKKVTYVLLVMSRR